MAAYIQSKISEKALNELLGDPIEAPDLTVHHEFTPMLLAAIAIVKQLQAINAKLDKKKKRK
jgi:hypothetical protein